MRDNDKEVELEEEEQEDEKEIKNGTIINDVMFTNSPLDQYLQTLDQDHLRGELIDFNDLYNNATIEKEKEENIEQVKECDDNDQKPHIYSLHTNSDINLMSIYRDLTSSIFASDILHPSESPFLNISLFDHQGDEFFIPPLYIPIDESLTTTYTSTSLTSYIESIKCRINQLSTITPIYIIVVVSLLILILSFFNNLFIYSVFFIILFLYIMFDTFKRVECTHLVEQTSHSTQLHIKHIIEITNNHFQSISKSIQLIREIELISKGYRFSSPLIPIERMETENKSQKSMVIRASVVSSIRQSTLMYQSFINQLSTKYLTLLQQGSIKTNYIDGDVHFNQINRNNNNNNNVDGDINDDTNISIIDIKSMYQQYQLVVSNLFTILIVIFLNVFNIDRLMIRPLGHQIYGTSNQVIQLNDLIDSNFRELNQTIKIELSSLKNIISNEVWENKIPKRIILNRQKKSMMESFIYSNGQLSESINSINPSLIRLNDKLVPIVNRSKKNDDDNDEQCNDDQDQLSLTMTDILNLDDMVNDFMSIKNELSNSLKHWEMSNRMFIKIIRSIPIQQNLPEMGEEDAKNRLSRLIEALKKDSSFNDEDQQQINQTNQNNIEMDISQQEDEKIFEAYTGEKDEYDLFLEKNGLLINSQISNQVEEGDQSSSSSNPPPPPLPPPPPPPNGSGIPKKKPAKRTVYDPLYDENKPRKQISQGYSSLSPKSMPTEVVVISELKSVLDVLKTSKEATKKRKEEQEQMDNNKHPQQDD